MYVLYSQQLGIYLAKGVFLGTVSRAERNARRFTSKRQAREFRSLAFKNEETRKLFEVKRIILTHRGQGDASKRNQVRSSSEQEERSSN